MLVVGGEEIDWILCAAYRDWRLTTETGEIELYRDPPRGTILGEGAAAIVLGREGDIRLERSHDGAPFFRRTTAGHALDRVLADLDVPAPVDLVVGSANGTFVDRAEQAVFAERPEVTVLLRNPCSANRSAAEPSPRSSAPRWRWSGTVPRHRRRLDLADREPPDSRDLSSAENALVSVVGLNHQVSAVSLCRCT